MRTVARATRRTGPGIALALLVAIAALPGCEPQAIRTGDGKVGFTTGGSYPPVGRGEGRPRVDALFAPGAQGAFAWLPDGTFWNGDFEFALVDDRGRPLTLEPIDWMSGLHAQAPAAWRSSHAPDLGRTGVLAFMPWSGGDGDTAAWTRLLVVRSLPPRDDGSSSPAGHPLVRFAVRSGGDSGHPLHPHAPVGERFGYEVRGDRVLRDGRVIAIVRPRRTATFLGSVLASPLGNGHAVAGVDAATRTIVLQATARDANPGDSAFAWDVWLAPVGGAPATAKPPDERLEFDESFDRTAKAWRAEMALGTQILLPDSTLQAAWVAAHRLLIGNRERRHGAMHFLGSPFQYRDLYLRDGARVVHALGLLGRPDLAGPALESLFQFQWPSGAFLSQRGQLDGTGQALWALASHAQHGGDRKLVSRLLEPAVRAARWVAVQRGSSRLRGGPAAGLLPYADPRDNELVQGHLLGNDAWALAGLEALGPLLRSHGRAATADTVEAEARAYRARLVEVWDAASRRQGRPLPPAVEGGGRDWGNLSAAYPCGVFAPGDARVVALDRYLRALHQVEGLLTFGVPDSLHHYVGFDRTQAALRRGDRATFLADLRAILDHAQPDGSGFELAARDGGFGDNLPPHGTFAAMFVDLVRSAIAYEQGDSLVLLAGLPGFGVGPRLRVAGAPTSFGPLDLEILVAPAAGPIELRVNLPAPAIVDWPGTVAEVRGAAGPVAVRDGHRFALPAGKGSWFVR